MRVVLPMLCLTCGYRQVARTNQEFMKHECEAWRHATPEQEAANLAGYEREVARRLARRLRSL
jgi:hypothetical protein